jgi:hypothetical protein
VALSNADRIVYSKITLKVKKSDEIKKIAEDKTKQYKRI